MTGLERRELVRAIARGRPYRPASGRRPGRHQPLVPAPPPPHRRTPDARPMLPGYHEPRMGSQRMTRMIVMTPSFRGDYELCVDLNRSVLALRRPDVEHHVIVPRRDLRCSPARRRRTVVRAEEDLLPRSFIPLPWLNYILNLRAPFPPVRGWIKQQILKLAAVARSDADVVVMVDSDIQFIRPFAAETFVRDGIVRLLPAARRCGRPTCPVMSCGTGVARTLLGLPAGTAAVPGLHLLDAGLEPERAAAPAGAGRADDRACPGRSPSAASCISPSGRCTGSMWTTGQASRRRSSAPIRRCATATGTSTRSTPTRPPRSFSASSPTTSPS